LLIPRGEALRQFRDTQRRLGPDSDAPVLSDRAAEALSVLVSAYNAFVALDPELARRDLASAGPESTRQLVSPAEGRAAAQSAVEVQAATPAVEAGIREEAEVTPSTPVQANRNSRRFSESVRNMSRAILSNAHSLVRLTWTKKGAIVTTLGTTSVGLVAAAKWAILNEQWLLKTFTDNPAMVETIHNIVKFLSGLPLP
jgi:hypothetical protein